MNPRHLTSTLLALLISVCLVAGSFSSSARLAAQDEIASQGRPITPAGTLVRDVTTRQPAVGALPVDFVRSPDTLGPDRQGRFLIAVNSGYGVQFNASGNRGQQSLAVIDLNAKPAVVVQNVYFPSPQSVNVGVVFDAVESDGVYRLYVSGGFENKIWIFRFDPKIQSPVTNTTSDAPFIDVTGFTNAANSPRYNSDRAPVYPTGIAIAPDGNTLFVANNLGDSLGIVQDLHGRRSRRVNPGHRVTRTRRGRADGRRWRTP